MRKNLILSCWHPDDSYERTEQFRFLQLAHVAYVPFSKISSLNKFCDLTNLLNFDNPDSRYAMQIVVQRLMELTWQVETRR